MVNEAALRALLSLLLASALHAEMDPDFGNGNSWKPVITTWAHDMDAAVSLTFDDNCPSQIKYAAPALEARGMKGTFFVITDLAASRVNWPVYRDLVSRGHEIGSHTVSHPDFSVMAEDKRLWELTRSRDIIDSAVPGQKCFSLALPMGWRDHSLLEMTKNLYGAVRIVNQWDELKDIHNLNEVRGMIPYAVTPQTEMDMWVSIALAKQKWLVEIYHGIQDDCWQTLPLERFTGHLDRIKKDKDRIWVAPFGTVARYIRERSLATLSLVQYRDSTLEYKLTDPLPDKVYDVPLTIRAPLPAGWTDFTAEQAGQPVWSAFRWAKSMPYALFEALPDRGPILLRRGGAYPPAHPNVKAFPIGG